MSKIPEYWKEWTRTILVKPKLDLTLADISFVLGEGITEQISHGATEILVGVHEDRIIIACNKGGLEVPTGYDPDKLYISLFKEVK